jgi:glutamate synthase domain-containing protein 3
MSGGVAYVLDADGDFRAHCNMSMIELDPMEETDLATVKDLLHRHYEYTESAVAWRLLSGWQDHAKQFVKVMPVEYRKGPRRRPPRHGRREARGGVADDGKNHRILGDRARDAGTAAGRRSA